METPIIPLTIAKKSRLFCPGPVHVAKNVRDAVSRNEHEIGHREEDFSILLSRINQNLLALFGQEDDLEYYPVVVTGSGTAANETILSSAIGDKRILIVSNGEFGERLHEISSLHNDNTFHLRYEWGQRMDIQAIETYIKLHSIEALAIVHHETSTGMLNPIEEIGALCNQTNTLYIVDTVSSSGAEVIDIKSCNIDFCSASASKAIGSLPGLSFIIGKRTSFQAVSDIKPRTSYLNLYKFYHFSTTKLQTPNTPAVQLFFALEKALGNILKEGIVRRNKRIKEYARLVRLAMKDLGFRFVIEELDMSSVLTTIYLPHHLSYEELNKNLKEKNIVIYGGKGPFQEKAFQISTIGEISKNELLLFLDHFREAVTVPRKRSNLMRAQKALLLKS
ncbi:MAG: putative aminotransferase [Patescibacteria group bacterium]|jgi:2-aminoethylphosphonate-pyruvate transaminase|nr:putative aminotransferase [Patescibacteria group bacterium]